MKDKQYLRSMFEYNRWANAVMYSSVLRLPPEEVTKERPTLMKSILGALNHLLAVDIIWLAHLNGEPHGIEELRPMLHDNIDDLWTARQAMDETLLESLETLDPDTLDDEVEFVLIGGNTGIMSKTMILTHLFTHGSYHRGWVADMYGQFDMAPPTMDVPIYERYLRESAA